jgi:hypothetical protein
MLGFDFGTIGFHAKAAAGFISTGFYLMKKTPEPPKSSLWYC